VIGWWADQHLPHSSSTGEVLHRIKYDLICFCYCCESESWVQKTGKALINNKRMKKLTQNVYLHIYSILVKKVYIIDLSEEKFVLFPYSSAEKL
jgi:hypothetical protein